MKIYQHTRSKHEGLIYACDSCEFKSEYKSNLDQHKINVHGSKNFNCTECKYIASTKRAMTRHMQNVHSEKTFQCEKCSFRGGSLAQINNHKRRSHKQETSEKCSVDFCKDGILDVCEEKSHLKVLCNLCGNDFESQRSYKIHFSRAHMDDSVKKYQCKQCDTRFSRLETLKLHMLGKHDEMTHSCNHCDFKTFTLHKLKGHLKMKTTQLAAGKVRKLWLRP